MQFRDQVLELLKRLMPELSEKYGVSRLGIFGSLARNDFSEASSDVDIIVEFSRPVGAEFIDLGNYLEKLIHRKVDLVSRKGIRKEYLKEIDPEIIYV